MAAADGGFATPLRGAPLVGPAVQEVIDWTEHLSGAVDHLTQAYCTVPA